MTAERVYTVWDYWDGPRGGIADRDGRPHLYRCVDLDDDLFELVPLDDDTLRLALEDWEIWRRWEAAFHAGRATKETHPALPEDRARHDELRAILDARFAALAPTLRAHGELTPTGEGRWGYVVRWLSERSR